MKWVQLWYLNRLPEGEEHMLFERAEAVIVGYPKTLDPWVRELRKRGVKILPYISFYKAPSFARIPENKGWQGGSPAKSECLTNPFWRTVATDDHPEWIGRDENGAARRPFEKETYLQGWDQTCPLVDSYREACISGLRALLADGYDGIFLDNVHLSGRLPHAGHGSGEDVGTAAKTLVLEGAEVVHSACHDLLFAANGEIIPEVEAVADLVTMESFMFSWAWDLSVFETVAGNEDLRNWQEHIRHLIERYGSKPWQPGGGPQPVGLGYLGFSGRSLREDAFTLLAVTSILGMAVCDAGTALKPRLWESFWSGRVPFSPRAESEDWVPAFYNLDLGETRGDVVKQEGCLIRRFDRGVCVFNPTDRLARVNIEDWAGSAYEMACNVDIAPKDGVLPLWVPPFSGRIVLG